MSWTDAFKVDLPDSESGDWIIDHFTVSKEASWLDQIRGAFQGSGRYTPPGTYTRLRRGRVTVMSDTRDEIRDHYAPYSEAKMRGGAVLINGLGLGMIANAVASLDNVDEVTVIEKSEDVIWLVAQSLDSKIVVHHADAMAWKPPRKNFKYQVVWHDIWDTICQDNWQQMCTLHRRYGRRAEWQGSWSREILRSERRRDYRYRPMTIEQFHAILGGTIAE